jgi:hypothetical protein
MPEHISTNRTVSPNEAKQGVLRCIRVNIPVFLWGPPGIGKSDIVKQIGLEQGREVIDIRLSLWEPTDIKGIPYYNQELGRMVWAPPEELPSDPNSNAILFLDELNSAAPATQAAAYQLILNRKVGTYVLPKGVSIVAAGNRESDRGVTYRMPAPLVSRMSHLELCADFDDWLKWCNSNEVHPHVVGYVSFSKKDLMDFDPKSSSRAYAAPRTWSYVSSFLKDDDGSNEKGLTDIIAGTIGEGLAIKFMAHRKVSSRLPNPEDILSGEVTKTSIKEISAMHSLTVSMCYELQLADQKRVKNWDEMADNFLKFMMDNFPTELVVLGAKIALTNYELPFDASKLKHFDRFHDQYGKYVIQAME